MYEGAGRTDTAGNLDIATLWLLGDINGSNMSTLQLLEATGNASGGCEDA